MKRVVLVLVSCVFLASAAFADITVTTGVSIVAANMTADGTMTTYSKGTKFRADSSLASQNMSLIGDAAAKQQWTVNHVTKTIEPFNPSAMPAGMPMTFGDPKVSVKPTGETKEILGRKCQGFNLDIAMPMTLSGESITMRMAGPVWVSNEGAGVAEYKASQKAFSDVGMSTSPLAQGPQGKAMAEATKALADAGIVLEQQLKMSMEGTGQMAQMLGQAGSATITMKVTAISTDPVPDSKFALPEGYTKR
jgi:hypothetical protein